jgi:hypothetical protein
VAPVASDSGLFRGLLHKEAAKESFCQTPRLARYNPMAKFETLSPVEDITGQRFPEDFRFQLTGAEVAASRSQFVTLKPGRAGTLNELRHKLKYKVSQGHFNQLRFGQLCPIIVA